MFEFRLAASLRMTVRQLRRSLDSPELTLWRAYSLIHGLPDDRTEASVAIAGSAIAGSFGRNISPDKLIPKLTQPDKPDITPAMSKAILDAWAMETNARNARRKGK